VDTTDAAAHPAEVREACRELSRRIEEVSERQEEVESRIDDVEAATESLAAGIEATEVPEAVEDRMSSLQQEVSELGAQVAEIDGETHCEECGHEIDVDKITAVSQASSGALSNKGLVTSVQCPACGGWHDVMELPASRRRWLTNRLRLEGVASGEVETDAVEVRDVEESSGQTDDEVIKKILSN
jgi:RNA polymerase-binding transcription factor DksA